MLEEYDALFNKQTSVRKVLQIAQSMVSPILTMSVEMPPDTSKTLELLNRFLKPEVKSEPQTLHLVSVVNEDNNMLTQCVVNLLDYDNGPAPLSLKSLENYTLVPGEQEATIYLPDADVTFDVNNAGKQMRAKDLKAHNFLAIVASIAWFVEQFKNSRITLSDTSESKERQVQMEENQVAVQKIQRTQEALLHFLEKDLTLATLLNWMLVRTLFRFYTFLSILLNFTAMTDEEIVDIGALCDKVRNLDNINLPDLLSALNQIQAFKDMVFGSEDLDEEDEEEVEEMQVLEEWSYDYKNQLMAEFFEQNLVVKPCAHTDCPNKVKLGMPFCREHMQYNLHLTIFDYENDPLLSYEDGVKAFDEKAAEENRPVFRTNDRILSYEGPFINNMRKFGISERLPDGETPYLPYSIKRPGDVEDKWADGSTERHVIFMIRRSDSPNVRYEFDDNSIAIVALRDIPHGEELIVDKQGIQTAANVTYHTKKIYEERAEAAEELKDYVDNDIINVSDEQKENLGSLNLFLNPTFYPKNFVRQYVREKKLQTSLAAYLNGVDMNEDFEEEGIDKEEINKKVKAKKEELESEKKAIEKDSRFKTLRRKIKYTDYPLGGEPDWQFVDDVTAETQKYENILLQNPRVLSSHQQKQIESFLSKLDQGKVKQYTAVVSKLQKLAKDKGKSFIENLQNERQVSSNTSKSGQKKTESLGSRDSFESRLSLESEAEE